EPQCITIALGYSALVSQAWISVGECSLMNLKVLASYQPRVSVHLKKLSHHGPCLWQGFERDQIGAAHIGFHVAASRMLRQKVSRKRRHCEPHPPVRPTFQCGLISGM